MNHLGLVAYHWGSVAQHLFLVEGLGPAARRLRSEGLATRFWFDRHDARGPHIFALVTAPPAAAAEVRHRLSTAIDEYLAAHPSTETLSEERLLKLHQETRGRALCEPHGYPGLGTNNSYILFEHASRGYPLHLSAGLPHEDEIWSLLDDLSFWAIDRLAEQPGKAATGAALRWVAALDRTLLSLELPVAEYWRYHATTLLLPLAERLDRGKEEVLTALPSWIGEANLANLSRVWLAEDERRLWPHRDRLLRLLFAQDRPGAARWALLREINHFTFKQLGLPVAQHIPLVLFAWHRNLAAHGGPLPTGDG